MVQPRSVLPVGVIKGEVTTSGPLESRIEVIHQGRGQMDPVIRESARRFPIDGARATIPIAGPKSHTGRIKKSGMVHKGPKKGRPFGILGGGIQVRHRKGVTACLHLSQNKSLLKVNR
jgi:hypothetical protein